MSLRVPSHNDLPIAIREAQAEVESFRPELPHQRMIAGFSTTDHNVTGRLGIGRAWTGKKPGLPEDPGLSGGYSPLTRPGGLGRRCRPRCFSKPTHDQVCSGPSRAKANYWLSENLFYAQFERFHRRQWLRDCRGLVMPPAPSEADGSHNKRGADDKDAHG